MKNRQTYTTTTQYPGFSLVELMIVLLIGAILVGLALPSLRSMVAENRMAAYANDLASAFNLARSEAMRRGVGARVSVVPNTAGHWEDGWTVFVDKTTNANGKVAPAATSASIPEILSVYQKLPGTLSVAESGSVHVGYVSFVGTGNAVVSSSDLGTKIYPGYINAALTMTYGGIDRVVNVVPPGLVDIVAP